MYALGSERLGRHFFKEDQMDVHSNFGLAALQCGTSIASKAGAEATVEQKKADAAKSTYAKAEKQPDWLDRAFCSFGGGIFYGGKCHQSSSYRMIR